jgi:sulfur-oxidizing protein SoxY
MDIKRRKILQAGGSMSALTLAGAAGLVTPGEALAQEWNKAAFDNKNFADTLKSLGGSGSTESKDIQIAGPEIAENGALVPVSVESRLPKTQTISIILEKNPYPLAASFDFPDGTDAFVATRVKMAESSRVYALVKADGKYFHAAREIKVTLGGCGG